MFFGIQHQAAILMIIYQVKRVSEFIPPLNKFTDRKFVYPFRAAARGEGIVRSASPSERGEAKYFILSPSFAHFYCFHVRYFAIIECEAEQCFDMMEAMRACCAGI
jgi:hypothetical protein